MEKLEEGIEKAKEATIDILAKGIDHAMNKFNQKGKKMIELIVNKKNDIKTICLIENGKLVEFYEESEASIKERNERKI